MGVSLVMQGRFQESVGYLRTALTLRPDNIGALERLGWASACIGQIDETLAAYRQAMKASPQSTGIRGRLVGALAAAGYWKEAEAECRAGLAMDPTGHVPLYGLVEALFSQGRVEETVIQCRKLTEIAPDFPESHYYLGLAYLNFVPPVSPASVFPSLGVGGRPCDENVTLAEILAAGTIEIGS